VGAGIADGFSRHPSARADRVRADLFQFYCYELQIKSANQIPSVIKRCDVQLIARKSSEIYGKSPLSVTTET
jgi:hypothetical protein